MTERDPEEDEKTKSLFKRELSLIIVLTLRRSMAIAIGWVILLLWANLIPMAGRVMAQKADAVKQDQMQVTETEIQVSRSKPGLIIGRYETSVKTASGLQIQYFVGPGHCSSIKLHIYLDRKPVRTTAFLGWTYGEGPSFGPLDTGLLDLGPVSPGAHVLALEAEGKLGGCNQGEGSPWWTSGGWAGRLRLITSPEECKNLSGDDWVYLGAGKARIRQDGNKVTILATWTPRTESGPHYEVAADISGQTLTGTWRYLKSLSEQPGSDDINTRRTFGARISDDWKTIAVATVNDPDNNNWNKVVFTRTQPKNCGTDSGRAPGANDRERP